MPIDRAATLRNAEKLLRQGKLDAAIAEYVRIVEDQPRDWNAANVLGDLYVRSGQVDRGCEQFTQIADSLNDEGFLPKAAALYKKILKLKPDHEHALVQSAEIAASQGLLADARSYLNAVLERRAGRGDKRGAAQIRIRLGSLDPADFEARLNAARARTDVGDADGALRDLKEIAAELGDAGRQADAVEALREAAQLNPDDEEIRERLLQAYIGAGDFARARACALSAAQLKTLSAAFDAAGRTGDALEALRDASHLEPDDMELRSHLARTFVARGDVQAAAEYLTVETAGDDAKLLMTVAEIRLRGGDSDAALDILRRLLDEDVGRRDEISLLAWNAAEQAPDAAFAAISLAAELSVGQGDFASAAAALQEFVTRVPGHVPALMRLVEVSVDGGLEGTLQAAQAQLADAYIAGGLAAEARVIAEDLVAREPWERANVERFRRALVLLGDPDPDAVIAARLSGQTPFTSTDLSPELSDLPPFDARPGPAAEAAPPPAAPESPSPPAAQAAPPPGPRPPRASSRARDEATHFELSASAGDLERLLREFDEGAGRGAPGARPAAPPARPPEHAEVDLNVALDRIDPSPPPLPPRRPAGAVPDGAPPEDLESVFAQIRGEVASVSQQAEEEYRRGLALRQAGRVDDAIQAFQAASRFPRLRFPAASLAGRLHRDHQRIPQAIEWLERAAQAPPPTPDEGYQLLYELADLLEREGEVARALAILLELRADAGDYRDVTARVDRLTKVQTRG